jgi:hypothetical protein
MTRSLQLWIGLSVVLIAPVALAQQAEVTIGYPGLPYKASGETNTGIQLSEGALMHVGAGAEAGYDSNVYYSESGSEIGSAIYRTTLFADVSNAKRNVLTPRQLAFDARVSLLYRRYESDEVIRSDSKNAWMPAAGLSLNLGTGQLGFGVADTFARVEDPPYQNNAEAITRYNNQASVEGRWSPGGGRISGVLRYINMVDAFDTVYLKYATSLTQSVMLDGSWKWLPKTAIFVNVNQGYVMYLNEDTASANHKVDYYPLRITAGLRGLLTEKTSAILSIGYMNAFTSSGAVTTSGLWGSSFIDLAVTVRPTMLSRLIGGYRHDFDNSVISTFSYNDTIYASYVQQLAGRFALDVSGRYVHRDLKGYFISPSDPIPSARTDNFVQAGATFDYFIRNWVYFGVGYALLINSTDITPAPGITSAVPDADYTKQQMFVRVGLTY